MSVFSYDSTVRVLIIEDEPKSAAYLRKGLSEHGYVADLAGNGEDGLYLAQTSEYDLLILDIMLPGRDGWSVLSGTAPDRQTDSGAVSDRPGLRSGPGKGTRSGSRRLPRQTLRFFRIAGPRPNPVCGAVRGRRSESLRFADLELDPLSHKAIRGGKRLDLTPKEFLLLSLLFAAPAKCCREP